MLKGKRWFLVDLSRPEDSDTPYIILESLNSEKNSSRTIHTVIINTDQSAFSLGRGHDSELRINDISVSRKHANLEYKNGVFTLTDLKSKFGTLVLLSHNVELTEQNSKTFQIGRTVVTLKAKCEAPWKKNQKAHPVGYDFDQKDLQKMERLLSANNYEKDEYAANEQSDKNQIRPSDDNRLQRIPSDEGQQDKQVITIDGKRYIVIKELDNEPEQDNDEND